MNLTELTAISPIDGRYRSKTQELALYFSEGALIKYRLKVEIEYFLLLCEIPLPQLIEFPKDRISAVKDIYQKFQITEGQRIKEIKSITNNEDK